MQFRKISPDEEDLPSRITHHKKNKICKHTFRDLVCLMNTFRVHRVKIRSFSGWSKVQINLSENSCTLLTFLNVFLIQYIFYLQG